MSRVGSASADNYLNSISKAAKIDARKEAMAQLRMHVDAHDRDVQKAIDKLAEETGAPATEIREAQERPHRTSVDQHWCLGSPQNLLNTKAALINATWIDAQTRICFDRDLRRFLREAFPDGGLSNGDIQLLKVHWSSV
jgi:hypothetical protein